MILLVSLFFFRNYVSVVVERILVRKINATVWSLKLGKPTTNKSKYLKLGKPSTNKSKDLLQ